MAAATLATASVTGIAAGSAVRASAVGTVSSGITSTASTPSGGSSRTGARQLAGAVGARAEDEAAVERRGDVVGMALELDRVAVDRVALEAELEQVVGGDQAGDDRRRARAEPAGERDLAADLEAQPVGRVQALERAHAEVRAVGRQSSAPASTANSPVSVTSSSSSSASAAASTS